MTPKTEAFNARRARAKRPCPLWIDAFLRDTMHLGADEVGAYLLILMAMWMRESCDFPDDDRRLAKVCRVSLRLWQSRIGPAIRPFFTASGEALTSKRLRQEAEFVERQILAQSNRKTGADTKWEAYALPEGAANENGNAGENPAKVLKDNDTGQSTDETADDPPSHPSYNLPTQPKSDDEDEGAGEHSLLDRVMAAAGLNPADIPSAHWMPNVAEIHVNQWRDSLGLTEDQIVRVVTESRARHRDPPGRPSAFDRDMRRLQSAIAAEPLSPMPADRATGAKHDRPARQSRSDAKLDSFLRGAAG